MSTPRLVLATTCLLVLTAPAMAASPSAGPSPGPREVLPSAVPRKPSPRPTPAQRPTPKPTPASMHADDQPDAPTAERPRVASVDFAGDVQDLDQARGLTTVQAGQPLDPAAVRQTLGLLYQTGLYEGIQVETNPAGDGVRITFRFRRQAIVTQWRFDGNKHLDNNTLARLLGFQWGIPLNPDRYASYAQSVQDRYAREGYPRAAVTVRSEPVAKGQVRLVVKVEEGVPITIGSLTILKTGQGDPKEFTKALSLEQGEVLRREELLSNMEKLEGKLAELGYLNGRVGYSLLLPDGTRTTSFDEMSAKKPDKVTVQIALEVGQKALVTVHGHPLLPIRDMGNAVTVYKNRSYSPYELDASAEQLRQLFVSNGYPDAKVTHSIARQTDGSYMIDFHVEPGTQVAITGIKFEGNKAFDDKTLSGQIGTHVKGWFDAGTFDPDVWAADLEDLKAFYATRGYPNAKVTDGGRELDAAGQKLTLTAHIEEGPQTVVARLLFTGATPMQQAGILQALPVDPGAAYNPRQLPELISSVQAYYARTGYPLARVSATYEPAPELNGRIPGALRFTVTPGPLKRIGRIVLSGNVKTADWVVRRQLTVQAGQDYNAEELFRTQQKVYQLGFFDRVEVTPLNPPSSRADEPVDLVVALHERESGWVSLGGGYDGLGLAGQTGFDVNAEYTQNNLFGYGYPLRLNGEYGPVKKLAGLTLRNPYLWGSDWIAEGGLSYQQVYQTSTFNVESYGPSFGLSRQLTQALLGSVRYSWSHVRYVNYTDADLALAGGALERADSVFTAGLTYDTRPDILNPRYGTKADVNVDLATPILGGTTLYTRPRVSLAHYFPLPKKIVFAVGADAAYLQPLISNALLPNDIRFLAGGAESLRGFSYNSVGVPAPNLAGCVAGADPSACVLGGTVEAIGHVELRFPVWGDLGGVVFSDFGNVWAGPGDIGFDSLKVTAGLGARYQTPVGPVRVDYGFRVRPQIDLGGFYFGIGQAF